MNAAEELMVPETAAPRPSLTARGRLLWLVQMAILGRMAGRTGQHKSYPWPRRRGKFKARLHR